MSIDQHLRDALERAAAGLKQQLERDFADYAEELRRAADDERTRAVQDAVNAATADVRRRMETEVSQLREAAERQAEEIKHLAEVQVAELRATLQAQLQEVRSAAHTQEEAARLQAAAEIDRVNAGAEAMRAELNAARLEADRTRAEASAARAALDGVRADHERAQAEIENARADAAAARAEAAAARTDAASAHAEATNARAAADAAKHAAEVEVAEARRLGAAELDEVQRRTAEELEETRRTLGEQLERARAEADEARRTVPGKADGAPAARLTAALVEAEKRILDSIRAIDDARSLGETLDTLAQCAAREAERAAVLVVKGGRLRVWRASGFTSDGSIASTELDLDEAGLAGAVVRTGVAVSRPAIGPGDEHGTRQPALPPFAQDAGTRFATALPIIVGCQVVAVVYADGAAEQPSETNRWAPVLEILTRHTGSALEAITVQQATGLPLRATARRAEAGGAHASSEPAAGGSDEAARRYARLLVSEIRMYHEPSVDAGRRSGDLRSRLQGEIDRARRLYEERVPPAIRDKADYFEQELVRTLADGDGSLLG